MSLNKIFDEFNELYGLERKPLESGLYGMMSIIGSEYDELSDEISTDLTNDQPMISNPDNFVKEGIDVIYATSQQLRERGVDLDAALAEVHRSNMSKVLPLDAELFERELEVAEERYQKAVIAHSPKGWLLKCGDTGKVIKPTTYSPAVITKDMY